MSNYQHKLLNNIDESGFGIRYDSHPNSYIPPHWHQAVELLLFVSGQVTCNLENAVLHGKPGDICILNPHEIHATRCSPDASFLVVHILPLPMCKYVPTFDHLQFSLTFGPEEREKAAAYEQLKTYMHEMLQETEQTHLASKLERKARLFAVTALLVRYFSRPLALEESTLQRSDMARLEPVLDYVQLHHGEELSLEGAAGAMGLNKEYFCRLFKKNMGLSFLQYVYQVRTTAFCRDLETTGESIGELAERHGFRDPKMLNQYFREIYGCTPSEKRKFFREVALDEISAKDD
ncbi:MAG: AraC family transcriptional regulator [Eubacteriales bacterium]|nr:AraC family transcriptional regulator [Eubacteriales bacterium]